MHIAILTFDGFNELDSLVAFNFLSRLSNIGWRVSIASPTPSVRSMGGLTIQSHIDLSQLHTADAVIVGSGIKTREIVSDASFMSQLKLDPTRQLIGAQCSGALILAKLGLLDRLPACTDNFTKPWVVEAGVDVLEQAFYATERMATAGGCMASVYLAAWVLSKLKDTDTARDVLGYVAPVGEKQTYIDHVMAQIEPYLH